MLAKRNSVGCALRNPVRMPRADPNIHQRPSRITSPATLHHAAWEVEETAQRQNGRRKPFQTIVSLWIGSADFVEPWRPMKSARLVQGL